MNTLNTEELQEQNRRRYSNASQAGIVCCLAAMLTGMLAILCLVQWGREAALAASILFVSAFILGFTGLYFGVIKTYHLNTEYRLIKS